jgi:hypothetical protein
MRSTEPRRRAPAALALLLLAAAPAAAQKDYYNTDHGRPVRVEDAYTTERYALELKLAPVRVERESGGAHRWELHPELGLGILPRTSVSAAFPFEFVDRGEGVAEPSGLSAVELAVFHNLNAETRTLPALALRADVAVPVRGAAGEIHPALTGIATRTFPGARFHLNARYAFAAAPEAGEDAAHGASRWMAGLAVDRAFPLDAYLLTAEVFAEQPLHADDPLEWTAGAGVRYQVSPAVGIDFGAGRRLTGRPAWYATFGSAYHVGVRALMPGRGR